MVRSCCSVVSMRLLEEAGVSADRRSLLSCRRRRSTRDKSAMLRCRESDRLHDGMLNVCGAAGLRELLREVWAGRG